MSVLGTLTTSKHINGPAFIYLMPYPTGYCSGGTITLTAGSPGVMTLVTAPTVGALTLGSVLSATGVTGTVTVSALASGTLNAPGSTYTLTGGSTILEGTAEGFTCSGTAGYSGGTDALKVANAFSYFYSDTATMALRALTPSIYSEIDATGIEVKIKQNAIEFDPNAGPKYKVFNAPSECSVTWSYKDIDANKIIDAFSAITADVVTVAPGASTAGRKLVTLGRQGNPLFCSLLIRYQSEIVSPGGTPEFRNILIPYCTVTPDWTIKIDKKSAAVAKITASAIADFSLQGTQAMPPLAITDDVYQASIS